MPEKVPESEMATQSYAVDRHFLVYKKGPFLKYGNIWIIFQRLNRHIIKYYKQRSFYHAKKRRKYL